MEQKLSMAILEAIKVVAQATEHQVSHKVEYVVEKQFMKKEAIKKTFIEIQITELV